MSLFKVKKQDVYEACHNKQKWIKKERAKIWRKHVKNFMYLNLKLYLSTGIYYLCKKQQRTFLESAKHLKENGKRSDEYRCWGFPWLDDCEEIEHYIKKLIKSCNVDIGNRNDHVLLDKDDASFVETWKK